MRVMIVEDEALIAMHLEMIVVSLGHEVCAVAATAPEAVARAIECSPDVALMDIRLAKGGSGVEAARDIYTLRGVRCIFLSANLDEATRAAVCSYEPIAFINKPVLPLALQRALDRAGSSCRSGAKPQPVTEPSREA